MKSVYIGLLLFIALCCIMIASPHFPNSEVSEEKNNDAFLALTAIGSILVIIALIYIIIIIIRPDIGNIVKNFFDYLFSIGLVDRRWSVKH